MSEVRECVRGGEGREVDGEGPARREGKSATKIIISAAHCVLVGEQCANTGGPLGYARFWFGAIGATKVASNGPNKLLNC